MFNQAEHAFQEVLYPWYFQLCKERHDLVIRERRTKKAVNNIYKCIYYTISSLVGWYVLRDSYVLPPALGGSGSLYRMFTDFPYIQLPRSYKYYFVGTLGFHLSQLAHLLFVKEKSNDFLEMTLHHLVTIYLYVFSYLSNAIVGLVIALLHDVSDVFITWTRAWAESEWRRVTAYSFFANLAVWTYTRMVVLPHCAFVGTIKLEIYAASPYLQPIFGLLLACLCVLHVYWFYL